MTWLSVIPEFGLQLAHIGPGSVWFSSEQVREVKRLELTHTDATICIGRPVGQEWPLLPNSSKEEREVKKRSHRPSRLCVPVQAG